MFKQSIVFFIESSSYKHIKWNSADVFKKVCADKNESKRLAEVLKNAADAGVFVLLATVENQPVGFNSSEVLKVLKDERQAILFAQLSDCKMFDISGRVIQRLIIQWAIVSTEVHIPKLRYLIERC